MANIKVAVFIAVSPLIGKMAGLIVPLYIGDIKVPLAQTLMGPSFAVKSDLAVFTINMCVGGIMSLCLSLYL